MSGQFALALAAGMAATVNPCGFALLPAYLAMFLGQEGAAPDRSTAASVLRAFAVGLTMTAGFVAVFGLFGLVISPLAVSIERYLPWATIVIGIGLVALGAALLTGRELTLKIPKLGRGGQDDGLVSMFVFGVSYAVASLSCTIGPFLAVTSATLSTANLASAVSVFVVYAIGMGVVVTALTVSVALARQGLVTRLRRALPYISRASGALLAIAGAYVAWYGWFEIRVLRGETTSDPIVDRAVAVQGWLQRTLVPDEPVTAVLWVGGALVALAVVALVRRRRRAPAGGASRATPDAASAADLATVPEPATVPAPAKGPDPAHQHR